jgi:toxin-antitoxin system PIN domain toxin
MIAVDTNVLVYAFFSDSDFHEPAKASLAALASGSIAWALPWPCLHEFYAVVTNPKLFPHPGLAHAAIDQITQWLSAPSVVPIAESRTHWRTLRAILDGATIVGPRVHDAKIAAICLDHGVTEILTLDRDFSLFPGLKVRRLVTKAP